MGRVLLGFFLLGCCLAATISCQTKQGVVEGVVVPACTGVRVTFSQSGKTVGTVDANALDGKFRTELAPGKYDVSVRSPASSFPVNFAGLDVTPGKTATLPPFQMAQVTGSAVISGTVSPAGPNTRVSLLFEGAERASMAALPDGRYEFSSLPAGDYTLEASSPGYASDAVKVRVSEDRRAAENIRLLYISPIEGVDWTRGIIRAKGKGVYPADSSNPAASREMARRAALSEAERNLLRIIDQIKLDPNHDLKSVSSGAFTSRIRGYIQGFRVVNEHDVNGGIELELELPLTGPNGLTRYVSD